MKKLDYTPISNSAQFFPKKGTLAFLQLAFQEGFTAIIQSLIGAGYDPAVVYVLRGVVNSGTYPSYDITEGVVFYNGEIFYVDAASYTAVGADVAVFSIVQTQYTTDADPCTFSDATLHNIHNIRKIHTTAAASGSGIANYAQAYFLNFVIPAQLNLTAPTDSPYDDNVLQLIGAYPNLQLYVPTPPNNDHPVIAMGSINLGDIAPGGGDYAVVFGVATAVNTYTVTGSIISNGTPTTDASVFWVVRNRTVNGFTLTAREGFGAGVQNVAFEYVCIKQ